MTTDSGQTQLAPPSQTRPGREATGPLEHGHGATDGARVGAGTYHGLTPILHCTQHTNTGNYRAHETEHLDNSIN